MRVPTAEELAAIAAAYLVVQRPAQTAGRTESSRWRLAGRLPLPDATAARFAARTASRWSAAARLSS